MILALLALAASGAPAQAGTVAGRAHAGTAVFLSVPVAEVPPPASNAVVKLEIRGGRVQPRISAAQVGSSLRITLLDAVFADLAVYFGLSDIAFRHKFVVPGDVSRTALSRPGLMTIENENAPTDRAYVYVTSTWCFSVAGADGRYRLDRVPAGKRRVTAWDEAHGTEDREVTVPAGGTVELNFGYPSPRPSPSRGEGEAKR